MNKIVKYILIGVLVLGALWAAVFFIKSNSKSAITYDTSQPFISSIEKKTVATGKVVPEEEIEIKPQISGIIEKIYLEEGAKVKAGDLIALIKVVPNEQALFQARGRVNNAKVALGNAELDFNRNKTLFDKGVVSAQDFQNIQLTYDQAKLELENAQNDYQIILRGSAGGSSTANTNIRATVDGTILEIPVEEGDQVIQSNNFNDGTTIASIADLGKMIFEGKVDEGEVGKLQVGTPLKISLGAVEDVELDAKLKFIAPKGVEETGAVQFKIEGDVEEKDDVFIRAGYSANASIVLEKKDSILVIPEAVLQFDKETDKPYVEVAVGSAEEQKFERRDIETGISDGVNVEVISGLTKDDNVKHWNKTEPIKKGEEETETE
ncbi:MULTISPECIES: efflux RND transporter periplasmic adaptor subunit [Maribacter]|uniref:Efflux RND transporter periplasmic adaptor subunit n=1 Tax=Maribacter flavus TaxID=1658664 RepID=A0ABU7IGU6_9FLAO|nr:MULTISPECIES: efflux RND transporter periplasmic adaptor subunit [Maribacter]MDC6404753.1 efflux RND transporter periplasmic adaptor subunit [Maribacter sp. PR66]MEE1972167.1 efflux RND transporter periplasmic adaptor subunit [Maribacter flavus]